MAFLNFPHFPQRICSIVSFSMCFFFGIEQQISKKEEIERMERRKETGQIGSIKNSNKIKIRKERQREQMPKQELNFNGRQQTNVSPICSFQSALQTNSLIYVVVQLCVCVCVCEYLCEGIMRVSTTLPPINIVEFNNKNEQYKVEFFNEKFYIKMFFFLLRNDLDI